MFSPVHPGTDTATTGTEKTEAESEAEEKAETEKKSGVIEVLPVGNPEPAAQHPLGHGPCTEDVMNVQNAVLKAAKTGQKVLLKTDGDTPFNFGVFVPKTGNEWLSYGVHLFTGVSVEGEKNSAGNQTTIENGWMVMRGFDLKGSGKVTVEGVHFKDFGAMALYFEGIAEDVMLEIRDNRITASYYETFSGTKELDKYINTDVPELVDGPMSPEKEPELYMKALRKLTFNPAVDLQQMGGGVYQVMEWWSMAINSQKVLGDVLIENNHIDLEEGSELPEEDTHVWWHTMALMYGFVQGTITFRGNTIINPSSHAIGGFALAGERVDQNNQIFLGPLGSYEFEKPMSREIAAGKLSVIGICAHNCMCPLEKFPKRIGKATFKGNVIICNRDKDALPLGILGGNGHTFESVEIVDNEVVMENGSTGITVKDVENASVARNTLSGTAEYGIRVGSAEKVFPIQTSGNIFEDNDMSDLSVLSSHVYFDSDTNKNKILGGKGTVTDKGSGNTLEGDYRAVD